MTFEKVKAIIADTANIDEEIITAEADLKADLQIDSLDAVEIGMAVEEEFGIEIPTEDLSSFVKVSDIVKYLDSLSL